LSFSDILGNFSPLPCTWNVLYAICTYVNVFSHPPLLLLSKKSSYIFSKNFSFSDILGNFSPFWALCVFCGRLVCKCHVLEMHFMYLCKRLRSPPTSSPLLHAHIGPGKYFKSSKFWFPFDYFLFKEANSKGGNISKATMMCRTNDKKNGKLFPWSCMILIFFYWFQAIGFFVPQIWNYDVVELILILLSTFFTFNWLE